MDTLKVLMNFEITPSGPLTTFVCNAGFYTFMQLANHVQSLRYERIKKPKDPFAILNEQRGTCSTKHQFLAAVAHEAGYRDLRLMIGIYAMSERNTQGVGHVLAQAGLNSIPEAHCYLKLDNQVFDFTGLPPSECSPLESLICEFHIEPNRLNQDKIPLHQSVISSWAKEQGLNPDDVWRIREMCIQALQHQESIM